jgi:hypothetical protein
MIDAGWRIRESHNFSPLNTLSILEKIYSTICILEGRAELTRISDVNESSASTTTVLFSTATMGHILSSRL